MHKNSAKYLKNWIQTFIKWIMNNRGYQSDFTFKKISMVIIHLFPEKKRRKKKAINRVPLIIVHYLPYSWYLNRLRRKNWRDQTYYTTHTIFHYKYARKDFFTDTGYVRKSPLKIIRIIKGATSLIWFLIEYERIVLLKHILLLG